MINADGSDDGCGDCCGGSFDCDYNEDEDRNDDGSDGGNRSVGYVVVVVTVTIVVMITFQLADKTSKEEMHRPFQSEDTDLDSSVIIQTPWSIIIASPHWMKEFSVIGLYSSSDSFLLSLESSDTRDTHDDHYGVLCCWVEWRKAYLINV